MTDITELAQSLKAAAEKATPGEWRRASTQFNGITATPFMLGRKEVMIAGVSEKRDAEFIALANPATILALVEALENSESRLHEVAVACATAEQALEKAQQQTTESENRVRKQNRHICELFDDNTALRQRIAELESRTVKLPPKVDSSNIPFAGHTWNCCLDEVEKRLAAAGIK
ncbi:ead/Ea22-like family protein, partial [Klebsiella pneumoniae]